jgi:predicted unusual protein kinase regulating ubiquinone biosynthesis (AarF/ABC1/UbiB family)
MSDDNSSKSENEGKSAPVTKGRRFMKLAGMTASVASSYAKDKVRGVLGKERTDEEVAESYREVGLKIANTLGELKGAVMKVGQVASQARDLFPPEIADALSTLQNEAPPMPFEVIEEQIEREFGMTPDRLYEWFDPEPFAAASIGQVHRARTDDGREVVVKVQYPGVDESCDSDLAHLKMALRASGLLRVNKQAINELFDELRDRLHEELDYTNEAQNIRYFRDFHMDDEKVVVPDVVGERSAKRVLTMLYEPGDRIDDVDPEHYSQEVRDEIAHRIFDALGREIFELHAVHGDPHPGNFAFRPDGTLVIYDFGCIKKLKPEAVAAYAAAIRYGIEEDYDAVERALIAMGARDTDGPEIEDAFYKSMRDLLMIPFVYERPYDFGQATIHKALAKRTRELMKRMRSFKPPVDTMFIDRVVGGHYWNLQKLGSVVDLRPDLDELLALPQASWE